MQINVAWRGAKEHMAARDFSRMPDALITVNNLCKSFQRQYGCTCTESNWRDCQHGVASDMETVSRTERVGADGNPEWSEGIPCECRCHDILMDAKMWKPS